MDFNNVIVLKDFVVVGNKLIRKPKQNDTVEQAEQVENVLENECGQGENLEEEIRDVDGFIWDHKANMLLLDEYHKRVDQFRNPTVKKKPLWDQIANSMFQYGYNIKGNIIDKKFRNMKNTFNKIKDNKKSKRTGRGAIQWPYYTKFDSIFVDDKTVNISNIVSTLDCHQTEPTISTCYSDSDKATSVTPTTSSTYYSDSDRATSVTPTTSHDRESSSSTGKGNQNRLDKYRKRMIELEEERVKELKKIRSEVAESNRLTQEKINLFKIYLDRKCN